MVMTPLWTARLAVELPVTAAADGDEAEAAPTLEIAASGALTFENHPLPADDLAARLAAAYRGRPTKTIVVAADRSLPYATVVGVLDACRGAGIERIGLVTSPGKELP
jgi:biopolymer transport protein ExbD